MTFSLPRTVLITGASRGIGKVVAQELAKQGTHCLLVARDASALKETATSISKSGGTAQTLALDLTAQDGIERLKEALAYHGKGLDGVLFNAAAGGIRVPLTEYPPEIWRQLFEVNVHSVQALLTATHEHLTKSDSGRVLFVSSGVARKWKAHTGAYAVTKAALEGIAGIYAKEVGGSSIRSNVVNPGPTRTDMRAAAFPSEDPDTLKTVDDIAPLFLHLLSPECNSHGEVIDADDWLASRHLAE